MPILPLIAILKALQATLPFDSIANPLLQAPSETDLQWSGDQQNLAIHRVLVNQAGYRLMDVRSGVANFRVIASATPDSAVITGAGKSWKVPLQSLGTQVAPQVKIYASNSTTEIAGGDTKTGYPLTGTILNGTVWKGGLPKDLPTGKYQISVGGDTSVQFLVSPHLYGMVRDAALLFFGIQRSGEGDSWFHAASHTWDGWLFDTTAVDADGNAKYKGALAGGWYDAGDHLKESRTQSFAAAMLGLAAAAHPGTDLDHYGFNQGAAQTDGIPDILRELKWGCDFALKAWNFAGNTVAKKKLFLSVGDYAKDHGYWNRPETQDTVSGTGRGNRHERTLRDNWGTPSLADWAAGLALASKLWQPYGAAWSDSALTAAKAFYAGAKSYNAQESSASYSGEASGYDDLALAATALLWASGDKSYLNDLAYTAGMPNGTGGTCGASLSSVYPASRFEGGFLGCGSNGMRKNATNTDWASVQVPALYAFHKLILRDSATASGFGISSAERQVLEERTISTLIANLNAISKGTKTNITLPSPDLATTGTVSCDSTWGTLYFTQMWCVNNYHMGNVFDLYAYWDMSGDLVRTGTILPHLSSPDWKRDSVAAVMMGNLGYVLGANPWDMSWLVGIGAKNPMHPHLRSANPEGRNMGESYTYHIPVGALYGGYDPSAGWLYTDKFSAYLYTEPTISGSAMTVLVTAGLSEDTTRDNASNSSTGIAKAAKQTLQHLELRRLNGNYQLTRTSSEAVRLDLYDALGTRLDSRTWTGTTLAIPHSATLRFLKITASGESQRLVVPPL